MRVLLLLLLFIGCTTSRAAELKGLMQASLVSSDSALAWWHNGTGVLRYDENGVQLQQAVLHLDQALTPSLTLVLDGHYYQDGEQHLGLSQLQLRYKPLADGFLRWRGRMGFFYPGMSLENLDLGWLSPYSYTQSAINSWIGEELRVAGAELTLYSPGRTRKSLWSWELHGGIYKGNDPLGTIISWRGFASHDRQSLHHDRVEFAPYPTVIRPDLIWHPDWVEPFHEIDGRAGIYFGAHLQRLGTDRLRYYYYDNLADPNALNSQRLYAWRTKFHSLAWQHNWSKQTRMISQLMDGNTVMGQSFVAADFRAWYLLLSHKQAKHRFSLRYDRFMVKEDDHISEDVNNSDGHSYTLAWRYQYTADWQLGMEYHYNNNFAANRADLQQPTAFEQQQWLAVIQYRWN